MKPALIDNQVAMEQLLASLENESVLAVDTEFFRETTYYPHLGLIQIASDKIIACIDPLAFDASIALKKIFLNPDVTKVFHSCSQDLEVLFHTFGYIPQPIHDTQIAEALLSHHDQIGYARLVEAELGIHLGKTQTRTNWVKRPLTHEQIQYAGDDVSYLFSLYRVMVNKLKTAGRYHWFKQDCEKLSPTELSGTALTTSLQTQFSADMASLWKRVKASNKLNGLTLAIIQAIAYWREQLAIETDTTRRHVLSDEKIVQLAINPPQNQGELKLCTTGRFHLTVNQLDALLKTIHTAQKTDPSQWPMNNNRRLANEEKNSLKILQQILSDRADELGISSGALCSRKNLESIIRGNTNVPVLQGWRNECVGEQILQQLRT